MLFHYRISWRKPQVTLNEITNQVGENQGQEEHPTRNSKDKYEYE